MWSRALLPVAAVPLAIALQRRKETKLLPTWCREADKDNASSAQFKRILVTGGAGFLGSHICRRLLAEGHEVMCMDNYFTSTRSGIADLMGHPRFEFIRHDVTEPFYCECDMIYNMACPASPVHYQWNPIKTTKVSVLGTIHMMGLAKRVKARILQASTSEIYGDPEVTPQSEEYWGHVNTIGVRSCYDEGKRVSETLAFDYLRSNNVDIRVARIFNTYGPGMHPYDGRVVSNFILQALNGEDITVYGDGSQTRSFGYVDDTVDGLIRLMNQEATIGPVNIGNPNEFTVKELAEMVIELTGSKSKIIYLPLPGDDPKQRRPNITRAKALLEWQPKVELREGLQKTIDYFKALDLRKFSKPTGHNAHHSTEQEAKIKKRLSYAVVLAGHAALFRGGAHQLLEVSPASKPTALHGALDVGESCYDKIAYWHDLQGDSCSSYHKNGYCDRENGVFFGFKTVVMLLHRLGNDSPSDVCCYCGGGIIKECDATCRALMQHEVSNVQYGFDAMSDEMRHEVAALGASTLTKAASKMNASLAKAVHQVQQDSKLLLREDLAAEERSFEQLTEHTELEPGKAIAELEALAAKHAEEQLNESLAQLRDSEFRNQIVFGLVNQAS
eukprot:symbB.v1.2.035315.t1/scaffold4724.1/size35796/3